MRIDSKLTKITVELCYYFAVKGASWWKMVINRSVLRESQTTRMSRKREQGAKISYSSRHFPLLLYLALCVSKPCPLMRAARVICKQAERRPLCSGNCCLSTLHGVVYIQFLSPLSKRLLNNAASLYLFLFLNSLIHIQPQCLREHS